MEVYYRKTLKELARQPGMLGTIFLKAKNEITDPAKLRRLPASGNGQLQNQLAHLAPPKAAPRRRPRRRRLTNSTRRCQLSVGSRKTHPKKTSLSDRPILLTFRTPVTRMQSSCSLWLTIDTTQIGNQRHDTQCPGDGSRNMAAWPFVL